MDSNCGHSSCRYKRRSYPPAYMIFEDWHLMLVLGVFILVHCAKPLCERCVELEERILACFHMASALSCVRFVMLWLCMLQPFLFCSAYLYKRAHNAPSQLVLLTHIKTNPELLLNETLEFGRNSSHDALSAVAVTLSWRTLDYMFFVVEKLRVQQQTYAQRNDAGDVILGLAQALQVGVDRSLVPDLFLFGDFDSVRAM